MTEKNEDVASKIHSDQSSSAVTEPALTSSLTALIAGLPEEERVVLTLFYLRSESTEAIAKRLAVPSRAVESVLVSGRTRLLASLGLGADSAVIAESASYGHGDGHGDAPSHAQESKPES